VHCLRLYGELLQRDRKLLHTQQQLQQLRGSVHGLLSGLQVRLLTFQQQQVMHSYGVFASWV
jgi:hypothetical protein